jgi:hypothetical protein
MCSLRVAEFSSSNCFRHFISAHRDELCSTVHPYLVFLLAVYNLHLGDVHHGVTDRGALIPHKIHISISYLFLQFVSGILF